jgi:hypothetical protein
MSEQPTSAETVPQARRYRLPLLIWPALAAVAVGLGLLFFGESEEVTAVRVKSTGLVMPNIMSSPDFYVELKLKDGTTQDTAAFTNVPIGGGLTFDLPTPVVLSEISQVVLYDDDFVSDEMLDRADVTERKCEGQAHAFELLGPENQWATAAIVALVCGGAGLLYVVLMFIRSHAL